MAACAHGTLLAGSSARAAAPSYTAAGVVNGASFSGQLAPYTLGSIFGSDLALSDFQWEFNTPAREMPLELGGTSVTIGGVSAPLLFVSPRQINFVVPITLLPGDAKLRVTRSSVPGPDVVVRISDSAPALFQFSARLLIAAHANGTQITPEAPARPGEIVVLYATGLGRTEFDPAGRQLPMVASTILRLRDFRLWLADSAVPAERILYVGVTPGSAGLYQINVKLPDDAPVDPEVRIAIGDQQSQSGYRLALSPP